MKKLDRTLSTIPTLLANFSYLTDSWDYVSTKKKKKIWVEIKKFQDKFCVYCELPAYIGSGHIEHFFHKGENDRGLKPFIHLTFSWSNLFGCCNSMVHCGHYKDQKIKGGLHREYDPLKLLKPDVVDPDLYFNFTISGDILSKNDIIDSEKGKADETIKALNLREPSLISSRRSQIDACSQRLLALESMKNQMEDDEFSSEYINIRNDFSMQKHRTAVRHAFFK